MSMPILIGCVGAGGTGKTTVVNRVTENNPRITVVPSVIRPTMKALGFQTEDEMRAQTPERRLEIQTILLETYVTNLQRVIDTATTDVLLFERTAIDHYGYCLVHGGAAMTVEHETRLDFLVGKSMEKFHALAYFPYPTPFVNQSADGFRTTNGAIGQNYVLDHIYRARIANMGKGMPLLAMESFNSDDRMRALNYLIETLNPHI